LGSSNASLIVFSFCIAEPAFGQLPDPPIYSPFPPMPTRLGPSTLPLDSTDHCRPGIPLLPLFFSSVFLLYLPPPPGLEDSLLHFRSYIPSFLVAEVILPCVPSEYENGIPCWTRVPPLIMIFSLLANFTLVPTLISPFPWSGEPLKGDLPCQLVIAIFFFKGGGEVQLYYFDWCFSPSHNPCRWSFFFLYPYFFLLLDGEFPLLH